MQLTLVSGQPSSVTIFAFFYAFEPKAKAAVKPKDVPISKKYQVQNRWLNNNQAFA
jgi:hypothetical protein